MSRSALCRKPAVLISVVLALFITGHAFAQTGPIQLPASTAKPNLHVVAIGVNNPKYMDPKDHLKAANKDAEAQVQFWSTQHNNQLFDQVDVDKALTNEEATSQAILASLNRLAERTRPGDTAAVALSGHGGKPPGASEWGFCAYDRPVTASELRPSIERMVKKGVRVLLIVDTCESGGIGIQGDNIIVLAACAADESAHDGWNNGLYTQALLEGLSGKADLNEKDGIITLAELDAYVAVRVEELVRRFELEHPQAKKFRQCPTCGRPSSIRSNLPLAIANGQAPIAVPDTGSGTGPIRPPL